MNNTLQLLCLQSAKSLDPFVDHFAIMMKTSPLLFVRALDNKVQEVLVRKDVDLTIGDIHAKIWQPVFTFCQQLINNLADQSIPLSLVDEHLKTEPFSPSLLNHLNTLTTAIRNCSQQVPTFPKLEDAVKKVKDYWRLCDYRDGAQVFLQLRDLLKLNGDFELIESRFSLQVPYIIYILLHTLAMENTLESVICCMTIYHVFYSEQLAESMKKQTLCDVDDVLINTGDFLNDIVSDPQKLRCLKTFGDCQDLIVWLQESTTSKSKNISCS